MKMWASLWWAVCVGWVGGGRLPTPHPILASLRDGGRLPTPHPILASLRDGGRLPTPHPILASLRDGGRLPTPHPIMASLRDTPMSPRPSRRSEWRGAVTDPRGRTILEVAYDFCSNSLSNLPTEQLEAESQRAVRQVLAGSPPPHHTISIIVQMVHDAATAYVHGLPVALHNCTSLKAAAGVVTVLVVHPATARVLRLYHHPANAHARPLRAFLHTLQPGRLLILAGSVVWLEESVVQVVRQLGVSIPPGATWSRAVWAWVGVVGGGTLGQVGGSWRISLELYLPRAPDVPWCGSAPPPPQDERRSWASRVELCTTYDGYGDWCSCPPPQPPPLAAAAPPPQPPPPPPPLHALYHTTTSMPQDMRVVFKDTVTIVLASRPDSLHRLLVSVAEAGAPSSTVVVFVSTVSHQLLKVCESHGVQVEETGRASDCTGLHIARLYESALTAALILRPEADFFITLEDDMVLAPTFYRWMGIGRQVLQSTQEFMCVNSMTQNHQYTLYTYHNPPTIPSQGVNQPHGLVEAESVSTKPPSYVNSRGWTARSTDSHTSGGADGTGSSSGGYHNTHDTSHTSGGADGTGSSSSGGYHNTHDTSHTSSSNIKHKSFLSGQIKLKEQSPGNPRGTGPPISSQLEAFVAATRKEEPSQLEAFVAATRKEEPSQLEAFVAATRKEEPSQLEAFVAATRKEEPSQLEAFVAATLKEEPSVASYIDDEDIKAGRLMAGWAAERLVVEALIRSWPLAKRDVDWETLVDVWAGPAPCLTPVRPHAFHARASHQTLGDDLPPILL